jgi:hypothetical protein
MPLWRNKVLNDFIWRPFSNGLVLTCLPKEEKWAVEMRLLIDEANDVVWCIARVFHQIEKEPKSRAGCATNDWFNLLCRYVPMAFTWDSVAQDALYILYKYAKVHGYFGSCLVRSWNVSNPFIQFLEPKPECWNQVALNIINRSPAMFFF